MVAHKKHLTLFLFILGISLVYFITRLYHILSLSIFTDEAIYVRWAQIAFHDANWRFISLTDGKQPLFVWIAMVLMRFISDPLLAGRFVSVIAGFFTMIGMFFLSKEIFKNKQVGLLAAFLYAIYPFALVYDRMALYDSLVGTFVIWGLFFAMVLIRTVRLDIALILGMVIGGGMLTKTNAFFTLALLPTTLLVFDWKQKRWKNKLIQWLGLVIVVVVISNAMYSILRLSPWFYIINEKNTIFVYPVKEWFSHPFTYFTSNLHRLLNWLVIYMTIPFILFTVIAFLVDKKYLKEKVILIIWFIIPFIYLAFFGKNIYPRFIFFMTLSLLPLIAFALFVLLSKTKNKLLYCLIFFITIISPLYIDYFILFDFAHAPIPESDRSQYDNDWPSGVGVKQSIQYFKEQAKDKHIAIFTEGTFGLMPYAYEIYLVDNPSYTIKGVWPINDNPPKDLLDSARRQRTYIVFYQPCSNCVQKGIAPIGWPLKQVMQVKRQTKDTYLTIYQVIP